MTLNFGRSITKVPGWIKVLGLLVLAFFTAESLELDVTRFERGYENLGTIWSEAYPPDWAVMEARDPDRCDSKWGFFCSVAWEGMVETLQIAFLSTLIGYILALPLAVTASRNLAPLWLNLLSRQVLAAIRVLPSLLWAILFVILVGLGPFAGVLAMTVYTVGYLGKLQYEALEGIDKVVLESGMAMGLPRWQVARYLALPEAGNALISQALFMFEYNVRHSTIIGVVGAGGIGMAISDYLRFFEYDRVLALLVMIFLVVVAIDWLSVWLRRGYAESSTPARASWKDVLKGFLTGSRQNGAT